MLQPNINFMLDRKRQNSNLLKNPALRNALTDSQIKYLENENKDINRKLNEISYVKQPKPIISKGIQIGEYKSLY